MSSKATSTISAGWIDLSTYNGLDEVLYDGDEVTALHYKDIAPVSHFTRIAVPLKGVGQVSAAEYQFAKTADFAGNTSFSFTTPDIRVKAAEQLNYRIAFSANAGHNVVKHGAFTANGIEVVKFDAVSMDALAEANLPAGKYEGYMKMIGNVDKAVEFSSHLPPLTVKTHLLPLWFCQKGKAAPEQALALCCLKHNTMALQFEFIESLEEIIRIQKNNAAVPGTDADDWQDEDPKNVNLSTIVDVVGSAGLAMPLPEVWCEYAIIEEDERKLHQSKPKDVLIEQMQKFSAPKVTAGTHRRQFHFSYPVRFVWFAARNATAAAKRNFSNYSTNPLDASAGLDPCRKVTLWYDNAPRFQNVGGDVFSEMEYFLHAARVPTVKGHHLITYCYDTASNEIDGSTNFSKLSTELEIEINETSSDSDDPVVSGSEYVPEFRGFAFNLIRLSGVLEFPSFEQ